MTSRINSQAAAAELAAKLAEKTAALQPLQLMNEAGLAVDVLPFGACIQSIRLAGQPLTLTYPDPAAYLDNPSYLGATIGRYANRIAKGQFWLQQQVQLQTNQQGHCLHGGKDALHQQIWQVLKHQSCQLDLYHFSAAGTAGFPGNLQLWLSIKLVQHSVLLDFMALSDQDTVLSLTNHCYFNLNTDGSDIRNHLLHTDASHYLPTDRSSLPTGDIVPSANTAFDFRQATVLAEALARQDPQLQQAGGFDHCLVWPPAGSNARNYAPNYAPNYARSYECSYECSYARNNAHSYAINFADNEASKVAANNVASNVAYGGKNTADRSSSTCAAEQSTSAAPAAVKATPQCHNQDDSPLNSVPWRATLSSPQSGLQLQLFSHKTGLQLYSGQHLAAPFAPFQGICLEAQHWPDAPNQPTFQPAWLKAGQHYRHQLIYQFSQLAASSQGDCSNLSNPQPSRHDECPRRNPL